MRSVSSRSTLSLVGSTLWCGSRVPKGRSSRVRRLAFGWIFAGHQIGAASAAFIAGALGAWVATLLGPAWLRWVLGLSFIGMAIWTLVPDKYEEQDAAPPRFGVFVATLIAFFIVEMGDKTQIATVALAARYDALVAVVAGTTIGMMIANVPAVLLGNVAAEKLPKRVMNGLAAVVFALIGIAVLWGMDIGL